jgi:hypothetical protein
LQVSLLALRDLLPPLLQELLLLGPMHSPLPHRVLTLHLLPLLLLSL